MKLVPTKSTIGGARTNMQIFLGIIGREALVEDQADQNPYGESSSAEAKAINFRRRVIGVDLGRIIPANEFI